MKVYRISSQKGAEEAQVARKRAGFTAATTAVVAVLVGGRTVLQEGNPGFVAIFILFAGILMTVGVWRAVGRTTRFLGEAYSSFQITDDGSLFTKVQKDTQDVALARADVTRLQEFQGKGFRICTQKRDRNIWVPCELEDYEQLKADVLAIPGVEFTTQSHSWLRSYAVIMIFLAVLAISFLASDKRVVAGACLLLSGYMLFGFIRHFHNPNLTSRSRRRLLLALFVALALLVRVVVVWRA